MDEDQTSLDNVDLYEDLHELFSSSRSVTDCSLSYAELQEKLKEKETQLNALKLEVKQLAEQNICLKKNISCLFKTAKNELQYKEKQINLLHARLLRKPGRKARKKKTPKINTALVSKISDQSHDWNPTESNKTTSTNSTTEDTNEAIRTPVTISSGVTQSNASSSSSTEVILNNKEVADVPPTDIISENETGNENKLSTDVTVATEDNQAMIMANSYSSANEEILNNDSLTNVPAELSAEVESPHHDDSCDNVSETVSVSEGEILSENEEEAFHVTGSCDAHHDTNMSCDHSVLSHQAATSAPQSDQSQNQSNHKHHSGQGKNQSGQSQNQGNHRGHCDKSTHHSGRRSAKTTAYDRPASQGKSRSISELHSSYVSRHTTQDVAKTRQSSNESRESSSHISSKSHDSPKRSRSSGSHDSLRGLHRSSSGSHDSSKELQHNSRYSTRALHHSLSESHDSSGRLSHHSSGSRDSTHHGSSGSHDSSSRLNCSSSESHDPSEILHSQHNSSKKSSQSLGPSHVSLRRSSRSHDSSHDSIKPPSHGPHDPLHHSSSGPHNSSRRSEYRSKELHSSLERPRHGLTVSCDSSRTLHRNSPQGSRHNSTPDQRRTSDSGVTRGSKRRNSNQDGSRDTLAKRNRS